MSQSLNLIKHDVSNPKHWLIVGLGLVGGIVVPSETRRRRRYRNTPKQDFGAFNYFRYVTCFGNPLWKKTHDEAEKTAFVVTTLLFNGATCVGKTFMDEFSFGFSGENKYYGTPINPKMPACVSGGSSSGSAVAVVAGLVNFAIGTNTTGCVRIPASLCGIFGFRPSHGAVSTIGVFSNAQSLDTIGWFSRDPTTLHCVGHVLLQSNSVYTKRSRCIIFADDLFQLSKDATQNTIHVIGQAIESILGYQAPKHMNLCEYIVSKVPSLRIHEQLVDQQNGTSILKTLSTVML
ncbi:hypothetical protein RYX36_034662 [Vicia faba]